MSSEWIHFKFKMVNITINISDELHQKLKNNAEENLRSMKNELIMIIKNSLLKAETKQNLSNNSEINNNFTDEADIINSI